MIRVTVLGAGGMGTALALLLARSANEVRLWARRADHARAMSKTRTNERHLPGVPLPGSIRITADAAEALSGAGLVVVAVPTQFLRGTLESLSARPAPEAPALSAVKGIEIGTFFRPSQIIEQVCGPRPIAVLSGPSHAEELARELPASVVVAGADAALNDQARDLLSRDWFRVYTSTDTVGTELAGALKNILGIAAGICDGLGFGDNAKAALLARGLVEISRFGVHLGGRLETFYGLAGVGDLITTCFSPFGRNRALGERIGRGETLEQALATMVNVAEGAPTTRSVHRLAEEQGVDMPIVRELHRVLFEGKPPRTAVTDLMVRDPKDEWE